MLLVAYVGLSFLMDPMGGLGTDTGGKVATMEVMAQRPLGLDPDLGYWAAEADPEAEFHGLFYTAVIGDRFVNVTTLPMLELGAPLYRIGGYRLALLLPMIGAIAAAFAARRLALRVGAEEDTAWKVFWVLGLASPLAVYALDFWEHAPGVALLLWGFVALLATVDEERRLRSLWWGTLAGLAFGAAYSMRTEALVYGFVATAVVSAYLLWCRRWREKSATDWASWAASSSPSWPRRPSRSPPAGETFRSGRARCTVEAGGSVLQLRLKEAVVTGAGLFADLRPRSLVVAGILAVALLLAAFFAGRGRGGVRIAAAAAAVAAGLFLLRVAQGGGLRARTVGGDTAGGGRRGADAGPLGTPASSEWSRLGALPLVWLFQFTGRGRAAVGRPLILTSGALLLVLGVLPHSQPFRSGVAATS